MRISSLLSPPCSEWVHWVLMVSLLHAVGLTTEGASGACKVPAQRFCACIMCLHHVCCMK